MLSAATAGWFEVAYIPKPMMVIFLIGAVIVDFITGLIRSWNKGVATSSTGFRKTVTKVGGYCGAIIGMWLLANILGIMYEKPPINYSFIVNGTIGFISFIELYSIFENISDLFPNQNLFRSFLKGIMKFLKNKIENDGPLKQLEDEKDDNK